METVSLEVKSIIKQTVVGNRVAIQEQFKHTFENVDPRAYCFGSERLSPAQAATMLDNAQSSFIYLKSIKNVNGNTNSFIVQVGGDSETEIETKAFIYEGDPVEIYISNPSDEEEVIYEKMTLLKAYDAPVVLSFDPSDGSLVSDLTSLEVMFDQHVTNVQAGDLYVNGDAAFAVSGSGDTWVFSFDEPSDGDISLVLSANKTANAFGKLFSGDTLSVTLDTVAPTVINRSPSPSTTVSILTEIVVEFSEEVTGVSELSCLVNGAPSDSVSNVGNLYTFVVTQPAAGIVSILMPSGVIVDSAGNSFAGLTWQVTLT